MSTLHIVFAGSYTVQPPPPPAPPLEKQIPVFAGFDEVGEFVYLSANVLPEHFGEGKQAPIRLIARAYLENTVVGLDLASLAALTQVGEATVAVEGPAAYRVGIKDVPPGDRGFVLLAEYPE